MNEEILMQAMTNTVNKIKENSGETKYLSVARRYEEQAIVYRIAYQALTQKKEKSYIKD